jgi:hypothetical protein
MVIPGNYGPGGVEYLFAAVFYKHLTPLGSFTIIRARSMTPEESHAYRKGSNQVSAVPEGSHVILPQPQLIRPNAMSFRPWISWGGIFRNFPGYLCQKTYDPAGVADIIAFRVSIDIRPLRGRQSSDPSLSIDI